MVVWAGRIMVLLGVVHVVSTVVISANHLADWFTGQLWLPEQGLGNLTPEMGAFWLSLGSFGVPLALLGGLVTWCARIDRVPPAFVAWGVAAWSVVCAVVFEPSPFILGVILA